MTPHPIHGLYAMLAGAMVTAAVLTAMEVAGWR